MESDNERIGFPPDFSVLFGDGLLELSFEQRRDLALAYIDRFSSKTATAKLLREAGITKATINPEHVELAGIMRRSEGFVELETRMNYCQYLTQPQEQSLLPFTRLKNTTNMMPQQVAEVKPQPGGEIRVVNEPFFSDPVTKMVRQYNEDDKRKMVVAQQMENQEMHLIGKDQRVPSVTRVGVLVFNSAR